MRRQRVLVLGINYAPEHTGIAPYTTGMASGLSVDYDVHVVTAHPHYPAWEIAQGFGQWRSDEVHGGVRVRRVRHYVPRNPTGVTRIVSEATFAARALAPKVRAPDVVVCISPALLSVLSARYLAARWRVPMGVVVQDLYSRAMTEVGLLGERSAGPVAWLEGLALGGADGLVAIHERFAQAMVRGLNIPRERMAVIPNWTHVRPPTASRESTRRRLGWSNDLVVLHAGNMGAKQGLEHVVEAAALAARRAHPVRIVLMGDGNQRSFLEQKATGVPAVDIMDGVPNDQFSDVLAAADLLLLHERPGVEEMCVPSKLTSYFAAGRPVLAATSRKSAAAYELEASGAGHVVEPGRPDVLLQSMLDMSERESLDDFGRRGQRYAQERLSERSALEAYRVWVDTLLRQNVPEL